MWPDTKEVGLGRYATAKRRIAAESLPSATPDWCGRWRGASAPASPATVGLRATPRTHQPSHTRGPRTCDKLPLRLPLRIVRAVRK